MTVEKCDTVEAVMILAVIHEILFYLHEKNQWDLKIFVIFFIRIKFFIYAIKS